MLMFPVFSVSTIPWDKIPGWLVYVAVFLAILLVGFILVVIWEVVGRIELVRTENRALEVRLRPRQTKT